MPSSSSPCNRPVAYISTRGDSSPVTFDSLQVQGLCPVDGGLYVPTHFPDLSGELAKLRNLSFTDLAHAILTHFFHSSVIPSNDLKALIDKSFAKFESNEVTPLRELGDDMWVLELYKGPTLSFKDVALQFLGNFLDYLVGKNNASKPLVVLGATSGDTGSAAIAGLEGKKGIKIVILYPDGRVSPIQEMQMIADQSENALVKRAFAEESVAEKVQLLGINSINIVRILVQSVYYFYSYFRVAVDIERPVDYVVPTGNFGDILAGYYAKRMGLPIGKLVIATNENDILTRFMESGEYKVADAVKPTVTPSMDIQVSSNFERYLFELAGRDDCKVKNWMQDLCKFGGFKVSAWELTMATSDFVAYRASEEECLDTIRLVAKSTKGDLVIDPHTAVGLHVAIKYKKSSDERNPIICLATAHPAKFPATVSKALAGSGVDAGNWISHPSLVELESRPRKVQKLESFALGSLFKYF